MSQLVHYRKISTDSKFARPFVYDMRKSIVSVNPLHVSLGPIADHLSRRKEVCSDTRTKAGSWLVLPFIPALQKAGVGKIVQSFEATFTAAGYQRFAPRISWCNQFPNLMQRIGRIHKRIQLRISDTHYLPRR